jgi:signal transduction histidine kinase
MHNEIANLSYNFDHLLETLEHSQDKLHQERLQLKQREKELSVNKVKLEELNKTLEYNVELRTQQLQQANKKLQTLDNLKNEFIANITHDFRSPLTVILNISELALRYDKNLNESNQNNYNLKKSIDKLLDIAKMDAERIQLNIKPIDLVTFSDNLINYYSTAVMMSNIKITKSFSDSVINNFYTDKEKREEILENILSNAIKFADSQSGKIEVTLENRVNTIYWENIDAVALTFIQIMLYFFTK